MKDKKTLLSEAVVKRFMKLAGTGALIENFMESAEELEETEETEELEEAYPGTVPGQRDEEDPGMDPEAETELPPPPEAGLPDDLGDEEPMDDELPGEEEPAETEAMSKVSDIVADAVMNALQDAVESGELDISEEGEGLEPEAEELPDMGGEEELPPEGEEGLPPEGEEEELPLEENPEANPHTAELEEDSIISEEFLEAIAQRVASRLRELNKK
jgi:hypothetical protein